MAGPSTDFVLPTAIAPFGPVPNGALVPITTGVVNLMSAFFSNPTSGAIHITLTDTAGQAIIPTVEIPAHMPWGFDFPMNQFSGLRWSADAAGLLGEVMGYPQ